MKLLKEPLLHFVLLGAALFVLFAALRSEDEEAAPNTVFVSAARIRHLTDIFSKTWQRPPTSSELDGLIEEHIREEILYREALALGLDQDDTIIRRRMRQKLEFVTEDVAEMAVPDDDLLREYLEKNSASYRLDDVHTFRHVYFNLDKRGERAEKDARETLARLKKGEEKWEELGDRFLLPLSFERSPRHRVAANFGEAFAKKLSEIEPGPWTGPIRSGYGLHLVKILERVEGRLPKLAEVRDAVARDWMAERRRNTRDQVYDKLREQYTIEIEREPK